VRKVILIASWDFFRLKISTKIKATVALSEIHPNANDGVITANIHWNNINVLYGIFGASALGAFPTFLKTTCSKNSKVNKLKFF